MSPGRIVWLLSLACGTYAAVVLLSNIVAPVLLSRPLPHGPRSLITVGVFAGYGYLFHLVSRSLDDG